MIFQQLINNIFPLVGEEITPGSNRSQPDRESFFYPELNLFQLG